LSLRRAATKMFFCGAIHPVVVRELLQEIERALRDEPILVRVSAARSATSDGFCSINGRTRLTSNRALIAALSSRRISPRMSLIAAAACRSDKIPQIARSLKAATIP
jgi:hypothetical protein